MKTLYVANRKAWRSWLAKHHNKEMELWLVYYKRHTGKSSVAYADSVEEAICFGWIDGLKRKIDDARYAIRFTPRGTDSKWSPLNIEIAKRLIKQDKMKKAGLTKYKNRVTYGKEILRAKSAKVTPVPSYMKSFLMTNKKAWENFSSLAPSYKRQYVWWVASAKREETRQRRLEEAIKLLEKNQKLGMK